MANYIRLNDKNRTTINFDLVFAFAQRKNKIGFNLNGSHGTLCELEYINNELAEKDHQLLTKILPVKKL